MTPSLSLPPREAEGNKGTFGSVCVIGGQRSEDGLMMLGAPTLAANAVMRSGCGTVMLAMPQPLLMAGLSLAPVATGIELPVDDVGRLMPSPAIEAIDTHAARCRCFAVGMGLGCSWAQQQFVATIVSRDDRPIVLDADGLNSLAQLPSGQLELRAPTILTPHVGEYRRLAASVNISVEPTNRSEAAEALAQAYGCVVVLKDSSTVVSDGTRTTEIECGSVVLATGGSGDVLTGIIAGLLSQYGVNCVSHLMEAAVLGVHVHARAGEAIARKHGTAGMLATDLLDRIPQALSELHCSS